MLLCGLRDRTAWVQCCFMSSETVQLEFNVAWCPQRPYRLSSMLLDVLRDRTAWVQCCLISSETVQLEFNVAWYPLRPYSLSSMLLDVLRDRTARVQCYFMSSETVQTISDGEPRTTTATFTQVLSSQYLYNWISFRSMSYLYQNATLILQRSIYNLLAPFVVGETQPCRKNVTAGFKGHPPFLWSYRSAGDAVSMKLLCPI